MVSLCCDYPVVIYEPVANKKGEIASRVRERDWDFGPTENPDASKAASRFLESKRREIEKATDLIFHL